jgi:chemotaxis protein CheD
MDQTVDARGKDSFFLERGYVYFSKAPIKVHTVLGRCVSVCLWDKRLRYGGMNHYMHPEQVEASEATPLYGNAAMVALMRIMEEAGCERRDLIAQIFGGGDPREEDGGTGSRNIEVARQYLNRKGVKIVSEDVGGSLGRKIVFDTGSGQVAVLKVQNIRHSDWFY